MNIALACDIVLAARSAMLQEAFVKIGLIPDAGGTWLLPRLVGPKRALALMLTADPVSAEDAHRLGLVYRLYDDATFGGDVAAFAAALARGPALALRLTRAAVRASPGNDLAAQLAVEARLQGEAGQSADFVEGVAAFREKRAPKFQGR
jgi:2-(1,2-epoxy-1,2-dihydrophenyl)acetyl-CoA isomerase